MSQEQAVFPRAAALAFAVAGLMALGAAPAIGSHVSCGDALTGDTTLDSDLSCNSPGEPALTIAADRVTLDLRGHTVTSFQSTGVLNDGHDRVTVRDGRILTPAPRPIVLRHADRNRLWGLTAFGGGGSGALLEGSDDNRVSRSSLGADTGGLTLRDGSDRNLIERNVLEGGIGGMEIFDSDQNVVRRNLFGQTETDALTVGDGADDTTVSRNELRGGGAGGLGEGLVVRADATDTVLVRNEVSGYGGVGFLGFFGNGIRVESPSTTLTRNSSNDNRFWGILAVPGVTDGGHNTASGNGVGQCQNVSC